MLEQFLSDVSCEERCEQYEAVFRLVWMYSHEISEQVTVIMGNSELICDSLSGNLPARKYVGEISRCAKRVGAAASRISSLKEHLISRG